MADNYRIDLTLDEIFGTGVSSVEQTVISTEPGGLNVWTLTLTNGKTTNLEVRNGTSGGAPIPAYTASEMTDTSAVYLYLGNEEGYGAGHWYAYNGDEWEDFGVYGYPDEAANRIDEIEAELTASLEEATESLNSSLEEATSDMDDFQAAMQAEFDQFIAAHSGTPGEDVLFNSTSPVFSGNISLVSLLTDYESIKFVWRHRNDICEQEFKLTGASGQNFYLRDTLGAPGSGNATWEMCQMVVLESSGQLQISAATVIDSAGYNDGNVDNTMNTGILQVIGIKQVADPEVSNARVGTDGTSYTTLKARLDAENSQLKSAIAQGSGLTADVKQALMDLFEHIGGLYTDSNARTYIENLRSALYPPVNLSYITAVYTQSGTVYDTDSLDSLKSDLVVTAHYADTSTEVIESYTLSGALHTGTSVITIAYGGKTTTFNVTVSDQPQPYNLNYAFNDIALTDGYINDSNELVNLEGNKLYDEFVPAVGFWLLTTAGSVYQGQQNVYFRVAQYDSSKNFIKRDALAYGACDPAAGTGDNVHYIKMGFNESATVQNNANRFVACNILDTKICTIPNSTINSNGEIESTTASQSVSEFLPINEGYLIAKFTGLSDSMLVVFYDENKSMISRNPIVQQNNDYVFNVTSNMKYVRFRCEDNPHGPMYVSYKK